MSRPRTSSPPAQTPIQQAKERRRTLRVRAAGVLRGRAPALDLSFDVWDLSFGGFSAQMPETIEVGQVLDLEFNPDGTVLLLTARVVNRRMAPTDDDRTSHIVGCEFVHAQPGSRRIVNELVASVAASLSRLQPLAATGTTASRPLTLP